MMSKSLRTAFIYCLAGSLWILFSDQAANALFSGSPELLQWVQTMKGWFYILATALLLFIHLRRQESNDAAVMADLAESQARFSAIFNSVSDAIFVHDPDTGTILDVNQMACELYGYTREELLRLEAGQLGVNSKGFDTALALRMIHKAARGEDAALEWLARRRDGGEFWAEVSLRGASLGGRLAVLVSLRDISARKRAELDLRESEARYRAVLDNISDIYYRTDADGNLTMVSPSGARLLGYGSAGEMLGRHNSTFWLEPEKRAAFVDELLRDGEVRDYEITLVRTDGSPVQVSTSTRVITDAQGNFTGIEGIFRDISERKKAEEALRKSEQTMRTIFDTSPSAIFVVDAAGRILLVNNRMSQLFGYPQEALAGMSYPSLVHPDQRSFGAARMQALLKGETQFVNVERLYLRSDGNPFWGHLAGSRMTAGDDVTLMGIITDISERKQAEAELAASNRLTHAILDSIPASVIGLDPEGRISLFNARATELTGLSLEQVSGKPLSLALPSLAEAVPALTATHLEKVPLDTPRGERLFDIDLRPLDIASDSGSVLVLEDVTERARIEEVMIQTEKMMSVGGLAAGMAHEINNPLGGIIQGTQVMIGRLTKDTPGNLRAAEAAGCPLESIRDYMEKREVLPLLDGVRNSAIRAARIVASMLEFSRKSDITRDPANINALLDRTVELCATDYDLKKRYDFRKIVIEKQYEENLAMPPCSSTEIEQVFMNILRNAAQALPARTSKEEPPRIVLRTANEPGFVRVEIEDNGPGLSEEGRRKVFEPFYSTKPPGEGTGLGLSVSYFIITSNHGGTIEAFPVPGSGTRFVIRLPA